MWNATNKTIPSHHYQEVYLTILKQAMQDADEFDPRRPDVYKALDELSKLANKQGGFKLYRQGLDNGNLLQMMSGLALIEKQFL